MRRMSSSSRERSGWSDSKRELRADLRTGERSLAEFVRLEQELEAIRPELAAAQTVQAQLQKRAANNSVLSTSPHDTEGELADAVGRLDRMREQLAGKERELSELREVNVDSAKAIHEFSRREEEWKGNVGLPQLPGRARWPMHRDPVLEVQGLLRSGR